jgi:hypothetical protein
MNQTADFERSVSEASFGAMTERLLSSSSQTFAIKKEIPASILKQLIDKSYEKRKLAGIELHKCLTPFAERSNLIMIRSAIDMFKTEYIESSIELLKKAGLMAFSAIATTLILNDDMICLVPLIITPVLNCFRDNDAKIRYAAVESMYNIGKVCRIRILENFNGIFKPMAELFADNDGNVKKAVEKFDSLLKTLVLEAEANPKVFNSQAFMEIIKEMLISSTNPSVQKLLVSWVMVLDTIPNFSILAFIHKFLEGMFLLLASKHESVRVTSFNFLKDLLRDILSPIVIECDLLFVMEALSRFALHNNEVVRTEAIAWTSDLLDRSDKFIFKIFPNLLKAALRCLADSSAQISSTAQKVNGKLMRFFSGTIKETSLIQYEDIVDVFMQFLNHESMLTRKAILDWIIEVHGIRPECFESKLGLLLETLTDRIAKPGETIIDKILHVLCKIAEYKGYFDKVMENILKLFSKHFQVIEPNAAMIVTFLCNDLGTETVYISLAKILMANNQLKYKEKIIQLLHELILTDSTFEELRKRLIHCLEKNDAECIHFFEILYQAWCINPISAISLSFLVQAYELDYDMLQIL